MKALALIILFAISISAFAQHDENHRDKPGHDRQSKKEWMRDHMPYMSRSIGASFQSFDGINARVANSPQYEQLKDYMATIGLGWLQEHKQFVSAGAINLGSSMTKHRDEKSSTIRNLGATFDLGYDVIKSDRILLYPFAGLGLQGYQAVFFKDNSAVNFDDVLNSPAVANSIRSVKFTNHFAMYRFGVGFSVKAPKYPATIGIQAGYSGSFNRRAWKSNEYQSLNNAPTDRVSQFFVGLVLMSKGMMGMR